MCHPFAVVGRNCEAKISGVNTVVGVVGSAQRINEKATAIAIMKYMLIVVNIEEFPFQRRLRGFNRSLSDCIRRSTIGGLAHSS
jgi:hypothetical protein